MAQIHRHVGSCMFELFHSELSLHVAVVRNRRDLSDRTKRQPNVGQAERVLQRYLDKTVVWAAASAR